MRWGGGLPIIPRIAPRSRAPIRPQNLAETLYTVNSGLTPGWAALFCLCARPPLQLSWLNTAVRL